MTAAYARTMFPASSQAETSRIYPQYERRTSYSGETPHTYHNTRPQIELPRPLEPRPTLQTSLSDTSGTPRRRDAFRTPTSNLSEYPSQGQSLPGLRDILTSGPPGSAHTSYGSSWTPTASASSSHQIGEGYYSHAGLHPPLALHPPADLNSRYQSQQPHRYEVPILETIPVSRQPPQALPVSPYNGYPEAPREYGQDGHGQTLASSYTTSGVPSPYTPAAHDDTQFKHQVNTFERGTPSSYAPTSADNQKKYLGIREVPGEGAYYLYEGGFRIPTHVDGEQVNPAWGLTKALKPRKRLALACLDCREKKIKCEPGATSCLQCEKAKRPCRRTQHLQSDTATTTSWTSTAGSPPRKGASVSDPTPSGTHNIEPDPLNKRRSRADPSPPNVPNKKHRSASPHLVAQARAALPREGTDQTVSDATTGMPTSPESPRKTLVALEDDPYAINPEITLHLLDLYFAHVNNAIYCMLPRDHFIRWVRTCSTKCQNERMLLHAMLALASNFADDKLSSFGRDCAKVARDAISCLVGRLHMIVAQTRMLLSLYHFAKGSNDIAWDYSGSAIRVVSFLSLHEEAGCLDDASSKRLKRYELGFSPEQLAECKRRTFWSAFLMDRYCGPSVCILKPQDIFVRLPCTDEMYERSQPSEAPYFPNEIVDPVSTLLTPASPLGSMAWLVLVAAIWGDVMDFVFRASHRSLTGYRDAYKSFYAEVYNRLQGWSTRLPEPLQYSDANLERSIQEGYVGTFISMHALYHLSLMKLNRWMRHAIIPESIGRNIREAHHHGHQMLQLMGALRAARKDIVSPAEGQPQIFTFTTPYPGDATLSAIDIVGGGGLDSNIGTTVDEIDAGLEYLRELSKYWSSARSQMIVCEKRFYQIKNVLNNPYRAQSGCWIGRQWGMSVRALEEDFDEEHDCIYGLATPADSIEAKSLYYDAFKEDGGVPKAPAGGLRIA